MARARRLLPLPLPLLGVMLLATALHAVGLARSPLPAQDGLKFIRVARQFHAESWFDVVRGTDRHPLYPAAIALAQPPVRLLVGPGPDSWRLAAQAVSALASIVLLLPLYGLARVLFDGPTAALTAVLFVLLPLPAEIGHDTLSDALALLAAMLAFRLGEAALRTGRLAPSLGCGLVGGLGYLTRPEVLAVPLAVLGVAGAGALRRGWFHIRTAPEGAQPTRLTPSRGPAAVALSLLCLMGMYALVKGEVSEKLALRRGAALPGRHDARPKARRSMPKGLDDRRWDFSPKEESDAPRPTGPAHSVARVAVIWSEGLGDLGALLALYGAWRAPRTRRGRVGRRLAFTYLLLFSAVLVRHAMTLGYLSGRHGLSLALVSLPWAAAGLRTLGGRVAARLHFDEARAGRWRVAALAALVVVGIVAQAKPAHPSRWGHLAAGRWLAGHMGPADKVLDTRGWAAFVADRPAYDAWHLRQALTDASLAYVVVGSDELAAPSRRAATLRAVLAYAAEPAAAFPERLGGPGGGPEVRVYRFHRPASWEGLRP